jgi:hypothetical protein
MQSKQITLNAKGMAQILLGTDKGAYGVGRGHYILIKENGFIRCFYLKGVGGTNDIYKEITMLWAETHIVSNELKPLPDYFDAEGKCLHLELVKGEIPTTSKGITEVASGVFAYAYDLFYDIQGTDRAGVVLHGIALDKFFNDRFGENVLKITENGFEFIQPVTFSLTYNEQATASSSLEVTVTPVDGVAPFEFSLDGETWQQESILTATAADNIVYVKDAAGTVSTATLQPTYAVLIPD